MKHLLGNDLMLFYSGGEEDENGACAAAGEDATTGPTPTTAALTALSALTAAWAPHCFRPRVNEQQTYYPLFHS